MKRLEFPVERERVRAAFRPPKPARKGAPALVVLAHGLNSCRVEWYDFPQRLAEGGYAVLAPDFRGHGESEGERGVQTLARFSADVRAAIDAAGREGVDVGRVALVGHSLGAALSLCAAPTLPVACLVALAPVKRLQDEMALHEFVGYNALRLVNAPLQLLTKGGLRVPYKVKYERLYVDAASARRAAQDDFLQPTIPIKNYRALVRELDSSACASRVKVPALVVVAEKDQMVKPAHSRAVYDALSTDKRLVEIPGSGHSMAGDAKADVVARHVLEFLDAHLRGGS